MSDTPVFADGDEGRIPPHPQGVGFPAVNSMKIVKLLCWEGYSDTYDLTPLCVVDPNHLEKVIDDWVKMPPLYIERLNRSSGSDIDKLHKNFIVEFPYFAGTHGLSILICMNQANDLRQRLKAIDISLYSDVSDTKSVDIT